MKTKTILSVISLLTLFFLSISYAGTVMVKPGRFDHFTLQIPERAVAGESLVISARVYDSYNNLITNFSESGEEFEVTVTGSAVVQPSHLSPTSFPGGVTNITVTDKKAETVVYSIYKVGGTVPVVSKEIAISPDELNHFVVQAPTNVRAGSSFNVRIIAKDLFDNTIDDVKIAGKNVRITSVGSPLRVVETCSNFKNSTASATLVSEKIGSAVIEVQEVSTGTKGQSGEIIVNPAELGYFRIYSPKEAIAGEPFEITVSAYDIYGNPINNYSSIGNGVRLESTGQTNLEPSFIKPLEFKNNEATIKVVYEKTEKISIIVKEHNKNQKGKSNLIRINLPIADHFVVTTPDVAVSGQPFKIKIEAYDRFNNLVKNYKLTGINVILKTTGTGVLSPSVISSSEFVDGVALFDVVCNKAESFSISAEMLPAKAVERITIEKQKPKEKAKLTKRVEKPIKQATEPLVDRKAEEGKRPKPKKEEKETEKPVVKEAKKEEPKRELKKEVKIEELRKEAKIEIRKPFAISNVSIIEAKEKAMLVINLTSPDGHLEYKEDIESREDKEWLKIKMKPVIRKTEKSMKFKSEFIGEVFIEEDKSERDVMNVYVELIPPKVTFDIARIKNSLIITVAKP